MDDKYLNDLYNWTTSQDSSFEDRYTFDAWKEKIGTDETYQNDFYKWVGTQDETFSERRPYEEWVKLVKKKDETLGLDSDSEDITTTSDTEEVVEETPVVESSDFQIDLTQPTAADAMKPTDVEVVSDITQPQQIEVPTEIAAAPEGVKEIAKKSIEADKKEEELKKIERAKASATYKEELKKEIEEAKDIIPTIEMQDNIITEDAVEKYAQQFYANKGLDYEPVRDAKKFVEGIDDELDLIRDLQDKRYTDTPPSQEALEKYPNLFVDNKLSPTISKRIAELEEARAKAIPILTDINIVKAKEEFDDNMIKFRNEISNIAAEDNQLAKTGIEDLNKESIAAFGVPLNSIPKTLETQAEVDLANDLIKRYEGFQLSQQQAANVWENTKTFYDYQHNKDAQAEYAGQWKNWVNNIKSGYKTGKAAEILLMTELGVTDLTDEKKLKEVSLEIAKLMSEQQGLLNSRAMTRFNNASTFEEQLAAFGQDPLEIASALAANSLSMMLPIGKYIVPTTVATGAAVGSVVPGIGTGLGIGSGLNTGMAITGGAMEYTNSIFDAMREKGYDLLDPLQVEKALQDTEVLERGREIGVKRGMTIGLFDLIGGKLAGSFVSPIQSTAKNLTKTVAGQVFLNPGLEASGEALAQVVSGQDISATEIFAEAVGSVGAGKLGNMAINVWNKTNRQAKIKLAEDLQNVDFVIKQNVKSKDISTWANKMQDVGLISEAENNTIQENVALKEQTESLYQTNIKEKITPNILKKESKQEVNVKERIAELLSQRNELEKNPEVFRKDINAINDELNDIITTREIKEESILNKFKTKEDAVQIRETETVDVDKQTRDGEEVGTGVTIEEDVTKETQEEVQQDVDQEVVDLSELFDQAIARSPKDRSEIETTITPQEGETIIDAKQDDKGRTFTYTSKTTEKDGVETTKFYFNRSDKSPEQRNEGGVDADKVLIDYEINPDYEVDGATVTQVIEIRENTTNGEASATVQFTQEDGSTFQGEVVLNKKPIDTREQVVSQEVETSLATLKATAIKAVKAIAKILPKTEIIVHDTDIAYRRATRETFRENSSVGKYVPGTKKIHINASKADRGTIGHEVFHALILRSISSESQVAELTSKMIEALSKSLDSNKELKRYLDEFAANYESNIQNEEKLAELLGMLAANYASLKKPQQNIIKVWLNKLAKFLGIPVMSDTAVVDFMNTIATKVREGEVITEEDISVIEEAKPVKEKIKKDKDSKTEFNPTTDTTDLKARFKLDRLSEGGISINEIISKARENNFPDDVIERYLKKEGYSQTAITKALQQQVDLFTKLPPAFGKVRDGKAMFEKVVTYTQQAVKKLGKEKGLEDAIKYLKKQSEYIKADDIKKDAMVRELQQSMGVKLKTPPSTQQVLGIDTSKETIEVDQKKVRGWMIKDLKEGFRLGGIDQRKKTREVEKVKRQLKRDLLASLKDLVSNNKITTKKMLAILNKFDKTNIMNPNMREKFAVYMSGVITKADYLAKIKEARSIRSKISKKSKDKKQDATLRKLAKDFLAIEPSLVKDLDAYIQMASNIESGITTSKIRGTQIKWMQSPNFIKAEKYINETIAEQEKLILDRLSQDFEMITGIDSKDMSLQEMLDLLNPPLDNDAKAKIEQELIAKKEVINKGVEDVFGHYKAIIKSMIKTGVDPFTGEKIDISNYHKKLMGEFMDMDLSLLNTKEKIQAVDVLNNFLINQLAGGVEGMLSKYKGAKEAKIIEDKGKVAKKLKLFFSGKIGKLIGQQLTSLPVLFERYFPGVKNAVSVMKAMGVNAIKKGTATARKISTQILNEYGDKFSKTEPNKEAFNTAKNIGERGILAFMGRNIIGNINSQKAEFLRRKKLIEASIEKLKQGSKQEIEKAAQYQAAYDSLLKDASTIEDVRKNADPINIEAVDWWVDKWSTYYQELSDVSLNVYNNILDKDVNYIPDTFNKLETKEASKMVDVDLLESAFAGTTNVYQKKTGVLMESKKPKTLPQDRYISLDFELNNANAIESALVDIHTATPIQQLTGFLNSDSYSKIIPDGEDRAILTERLKSYVRRIRGKEFVDSSEIKSIAKAAETIAGLGVTRALGGITQPIKQTIPVMMNTLINAGNLDITSVMDKDVDNFISNSGYGIATRGITSETTLDNINKALEKATTSKYLTGLNWLKKANRMWLDIFLVAPDRWIARASWFTYYKKSLTEQGIDVNKIDWNTHEVNKEAGDYAQQMVDRQQNVSDADLQGDFLTSKDDVKKITRKIIIPFMNFVINQKARMYSDIIALGDKTTSKEDRESAVRSLAGLAIETTTFHALSISITMLMFEAAALALGYDEEDEEEIDRIRKRIKGSVTNTLTDVISPFPAADYPVLYLLNESLDLAQYDIPDDEKFKLYNKEEKGWFEGLGVLGIAAEKIFDELYKVGTLAYDGTITTTNSVGKESVKTVDKETQEVMQQLLPIAVAYNLGLLPTEVGGVIRYSLKIAKDTAKTAKQVEKAQKKADAESSNTRTRKLKTRKLKTRKLRTRKLRTR